MAAHRVDEHGRPDPTFGENGTAVTREPDLQLGEALAIQPDGKLVIAGATFTPVDGNALMRRLDVHGQPDPTFGENGTQTIDGGAIESAAAVAVRPDGTIVVAGRTNVGADALLYGLTPGGELDPAFGDGGTVRLDSGANEAATSVALQADGKILVAGASQTQAGMTAVLYRVLAGGARDVGFGRGGEVRVDAGGLRLAWAMAPQADGEVVLGGGDGRDALVVRLLGDDPPLPPPPRLIEEPPCEALGICESGKPATPTTPPAADRLAPRVTGVAYYDRRRSRLRFRLSEPASVRIAVRRCKRRCTPAGAVSRSNLPAGASTIALRKRPGRYRVTVTATDRAGNRSSPARAGFTIARGGATSDVTPKPRRLKT